MRPNVGAVGGNENRDVSDDPDTFGSGIIPEGFPLAKEEKLPERMPLHPVGEFLLGGRKTCGLASSVSLGPLIPSLLFVRILQSHEERKVLQPHDLFPLEGRQLFAELFI